MNTIYLTLLLVLGTTHAIAECPFNADINNDHIVNAVDVQLVTNAALRVGKIKKNY